MFERQTPLLAGLKAIDWLGVSTVTAATLLFLLGLGFGGVSFPWNSTTVLHLPHDPGWLLCHSSFFFNLPVEDSQTSSDASLWHCSASHRSNATAALIVCFCHGFIIISFAYFIPLYVLPTGWF